MIQMLSGMKNLLMLLGGKNFMLYFFLTWSQEHYFKTIKNDTNVAFYKESV